MSALVERANREASSLLAEAGVFGVSTDIYRVVAEAYQNGYVEGKADAERELREFAKALAGEQQ